jgi:putative ABC transport system permease protein
MRDWKRYVEAHLALSPLKRERAERIINELASQLGDCYHEALARGATEDEANQCTVDQIGDWDQLTAEILSAERISTEAKIEQVIARTEEGIRQRGGGWILLAELVLNFRYGFRTLWKSPGFLAVAVLTLGLGIGANTALFSLVNGVLLSPLPYESPEGLVSVWSSNVARGVNRGGVSLHDFADWQERTNVFADVAVYNSNTTNLAGLDRPQRIGYAQVTPSLFTTLGANPLQGRLFSADENLPGNDDVVILSHGFWESSFGGDSEVIGSRLMIDGRPMTVVGIMPPGFAFPSPRVQLWKPFGMLPEDEGTRAGRWTSAVARLRDDLSIEQTQASLTGLAELLAQEYPETNTGFGIYIEPMQTTIVGGFQRTLLVLWGTSAFVLLIACTNLANLLYARALSREREIAVRTVLGATRKRLILQLLAESLPLSLLGGALGLVLATAGMRMLVVLNDGRIPRLGEVSINFQVLVYSLLVALGVGTLFSILPALRAARSELVGSLKEGGRGSVGPGRSRIRSSLVVVQIALAMVVVVGAGLLVRSHATLSSVDPGFATQNALTIRIAPSWQEYPERAQAVQLYQEIVDHLETIPTVRAVSAANRLPLAGGWWTTHIRIDGRETPPTSNPRVAYTRVVLPAYHSTMGIPLLRGRRLGSADDAESQKVVLINQAMADAWWPKESPIGQRVSTGGPWRTIVGVVGSSRHGFLGQEPSPILYVPFAQGGYGHFQDWGMTFVVRVAADAESQTGVIRRAFSGVAPDLPLFEIATLGEVIGKNVASERFNAQLMGIFAAISLLLAGVGVYSVMAHAVYQRTREIGVRVALGATQSSVLGLVVKRGVVLASAGILIGLVVSAWVSRFIAELLYQTSAIDPLIYSTVAVLLGLAALAACAMPAIRATRVDPMNVLRGE